MGLVIDEMPELGVTRISRWVFNCYVIHNDGDAIVVDAGLPSAAADVAPVLTGSAGTSARSWPPMGTAITSPAPPALAARYAAPIHLPTVTMTYLDGQRPRTPSAARVARIWPTLIDQPLDGSARWGCFRVPAGPGMGPPPVCDGRVHPRRVRLPMREPLPGAPEWLILATPGHTDDSVAFWNPTEPRADSRVTPF